MPRCERVSGRPGEQIQREPSNLDYFKTILNKTNGVQPQPVAVANRPGRQGSFELFTLDECARYPNNPMNWLPRRKTGICYYLRCQLTRCGGAGWFDYFSLISSQHGNLSKIAPTARPAQNKIEDIEKTIKNVPA